jgi:hypothetical protein
MPSDVFGFVLLDSIFGWQYPSMVSSLFFVKDLTHILFMLFIIHEFKSLLLPFSFELIFLGLDLGWIEEICFPLVFS